MCAAAAMGSAGAASSLVALAVAISLPFTIADLADVRDKSAERALRENKLVTLVEARAADVDRCGLIRVPSFRIVPPVAHCLDIAPDRFTDTTARALSIAAAGDRTFVVEHLAPDPSTPRTDQREGRRSHSRRLAAHRGLLNLRESHP